jgi:PAS domain S-box-containing protein
VVLKVVTPSREGLLRDQLNFETLLSQISSRFVSIPSDEVDRGIEEALRVICNSLNVDESTIYLRDPSDPDVYVLSYVLRDPELPPPPKTRFTTAENFPWCNKKLIANEIICLSDTQAAPPEASIDKASWKKYGICSALVIPLSTGRRHPVGFWGIDSTTEQRDWPESIQSRLKLLADVFANALERSDRERRLRESEARLRLASNTTGAGFWTIDVSTGAVWATPKLEELFGLAAEQNTDIPGFLALIHGEDRELVNQAIASMMAGQETTVEYRIVARPGSLHWVMSRGNRYEFDEEKPILMGITVEITERRRNEEALRTVTGRLIVAQEEERKRIARELHDAVGQQIAVISMHLQQLNVDERADGRKRRGDQLSAEIQGLSQSIQTLSRELHSSSLDYLGLAAAMDGLCRQLRQSHNLEVDFAASNVPRGIPSDVRLAAFRITQEALHNVFKHSGQNRARVNLEGSPSQIQLTICDDGAGFDVNVAMLGHGLGLISMRERVFALKGQITVWSRPGEGTEIRVYLPIVPAEASASNGPKKA